MTAQSKLIIKFQYYNGLNDCRRHFLSHRGIYRLFGFFRDSTSSVSRLPDYIDVRDDFENVAVNGVDNLSCCCLNIPFKQCGFIHLHVRPQAVT